MADERLLALIGQLVESGVPFGPLTRALAVLDRGGTIREATDAYERDESHLLFGAISVNGRLPADDFERVLADQLVNLGGSMRYAYERKDTNV